MGRKEGEKEERKEGRKAGSKGGKQMRLECVNLLMSHLYVKWEFWRLWEIIYKVLAVVSDYKKWQISSSPSSLRVLLTRVCTNTLVCQDVLTHLDNPPTHVSTHFDLTSNSRNSENSLLPNLLITPLLKNSLNSMLFISYLTSLQPLSLLRNSYFGKPSASVAFVLRRPSAIAQCPSWASDPGPPTMWGVEFSRFKKQNSKLFLKFHFWEKIENEIIANISLQARL